MPPKKMITTHVLLLRYICLKEGMGDEGREMGGCMSQFSDEPQHCPHLT